MLAVAQQRLFSAVSVITLFLGSCARQGTVVDHRSPVDSQGASAQATAPETMIKSKEIALSGFPDWCAAKAQDDGTTCVDCVRTTDSQDKANVGHLCFQPRSDFDAKTQCGLSKTDVGIKLLQCHTTDKDVIADVSLLSDKAVTVLTTTLFAIKNALGDAYQSDATSLTIATTVVQFASDHTLDVLSGKNIDQTASDLLLLANKYLVTPYPDGSTKDAIKTQLVTKLNDLHNAVAGTGDFSVAKLFTAVLDVAHVFPNDRLGKAADVLTGAGLAKLIESHKTEIDPAIAGWSDTALGFKTSDDLISQIKGN